MSLSSVPFIIIDHRSLLPSFRNEANKESDNKKRRICFIFVCVAFADSCKFLCFVDFLSFFVQARSTDERSERSERPKARRKPNTKNFSWGCDCYTVSLAYYLHWNFNLDMPKIFHTVILSMLMAALNGVYCSIVTTVEPQFSHL